MDHDHHPHDADEVDPGMATATDPVCGMTVTPGKARGGSATHDGQEYWFCNPRCREKFVADPARYLTAAPSPAPSQAPQGLIKLRGPGKPRAPAAAQEPVPA